ncbi:M6 metalloprotease [Trichodelitschia bisporula]|uniref:M6 metalloprotease n=1 Tax=Trichodelitschia bisporula TaxID=703511 RepID=A0A6G1HLT7_9PEZI|nr:M6 metalloprotease [Trichodelitschia bisporula]
MRLTPALAAAAALFHVPEVTAHVSIPQALNEAFVAEKPDYECKLAAPSFNSMSEGFGPRTAFASSTGPLRAAMVFVDFPDAPATDTPGSLLQAFMPAAADWYNASSYGRLHLTVAADTRKFYRMPRPSAEYSWNRAGFTSQKQERYIKDAIAAIGAEFKPGPTDVLYIVPTRQAARIGFSPTSLTPMALADGTRVKGTVTFGQDLWTAWGFKVLNHETGHVMGLPDLYPMDGRATGLWVGGFDIMGLISGSSPDYLGWHKWKLGWVDNAQVSCAKEGESEHVLTPVEVAGGTKMAVVKVSDSVAVVAEVRTDAGLNHGSCSKGLLVYVVDASKWTGNGPIVVQSGKAGTVRGCAPSKGGPLTSAAFDFAAKEAMVDVKKYGVTITTTAVEGANYRIKIKYAPVAGGRPKPAGGFLGFGG